MRRLLISIGLFLSMTAAAPQPTETFAYAGYSLHTDLSQLRAKLPNSEHNAQASSYYVVVSPKDAGTSRLQHILFRIDKTGHIESVYLSFEVPHELRKKMRGPRCSDIESSLVRRYGPVMEIEEPWYEEAVLHRPKIWFSDREELIWDCSEYAIRIQRRPTEEQRDSRIRVH